MFEDDIEDEDLDIEEADDISLDEVAEVEDDAAIADDVVESDDEEGYSAPVVKSKAVMHEDLPSLEAKKKDRDALAQAMEAFLARGGKIQEVGSE